MHRPMLQKGCRALAMCFLANLLLVPAIRANELALKQAEKQLNFMTKAGVLSGNFLDQKKAMETLKQRVRDSRLDLELNGISRYREKTETMIDVERQRLRRAIQYLVDEGHKEKLLKEVRRTGHKELIQLANHMESSGFAENDVLSVADNYMDFRFSGYRQAIDSLDEGQIRKMMTDTEEAADDYIRSGGDLRTLNRGIFLAADDSGKEEGEEPKNKIIRWVVAAIAGAGLLIAIFFSFTTMTFTPFLSFMATITGVMGLLGKHSAFSNIFFGNPYGATPGGVYGPYNPWNPYWPPQGFPPAHPRG